MNCHQCIYKKYVPGDAHIQCIHPELEKPGELINTISSIFAPESNPVAKKLNITMNQHGIRNGWCSWPMNFDPIWINNCQGFTTNEQKEINQNLPENS